MESQNSTVLIHRYMRLSLHPLPLNNSDKGEGLLRADLSIELAPKTSITLLLQSNTTRAALSPRKNEHDPLVKPTAWAAEAKSATKPEGKTQETCGHGAVPHPPRPRDADLSGTLRPPSHILRAIPCERRRKRVS